MASIQRNRQVWEHEYDWIHRGDEWSESWGGAASQWYGALLPRIHSFLPAPTILEIAPGFGRWSQFLAPLCDRLYLVDLSAGCIEACRERFAAHSHIEYHVNDGRSLEMIPDASVDFAFSFDSLVHAEADVLNAYVLGLAKKLAPSGVAFLHHSNIGEYTTHYAWAQRIPKGRRTLARLGLVEATHHARAFSMTAARFRTQVKEAGLRCISQELMNWGSRRLIDCISVITPPGSVFARRLRIVRNPGFMREAAQLKRLAALYSARDESPHS